MTELRTTNYVLPAHWACVLINGDYTGLSEQDEAEFESFNNGEFGDRDFDDIWLANDNEPEFVKYHDAHQYGVAACDCLTYTFVC